MNFLAHIYLAGESDHLIVGNFLADFLSNKEVARLPIPIQAGVAMHRKIDSFTDQHPVVRQSIKRLQHKHGKYAPVVLDILHDYILVKNWSTYSKIEVGDFAKNAYETLMSHTHLMPSFLQDRLPLMVADNWLVRYGTEEGIAYTFDRIKMRSSAPQYLDGGVESLKKHYPHLNDEFNRFFPDLIALVRQ